MAISSSGTVITISSGEHTLDDVITAVPAAFDTLVSGGTTGVTHDIIECTYQIQIQAGGILNIDNTTLIFEGVSYPQININSTNSSSRAICRIGTSGQGDTTVILNGAASHAAGHRGIDVRNNALLSVNGIIYSGFPIGQQNASLSNSTMEITDSTFIMRDLVGVNNGHELQLRLFSSTNSINGLKMVGGSIQLAGQPAQLRNVNLDDSTIATQHGNGFLSGYYDIYGDINVTQRGTRSRNAVSFSAQIGLSNRIKGHTVAVHNTSADFNLVEGFRNRSNVGTSILLNQVNLELLDAITGATITQINGVLTDTDSGNRTASVAGDDIISGNQLIPHNFNHDLTYDVTVNSTSSKVELSTTLVNGSGRLKLNGVVKNIWNAPRSTYDANNSFVPVDDNRLPVSGELRNAEYLPLSISLTSLNNVVNQPVYMLPDTSFTLSRTDAAALTIANSAADVYCAYKIQWEKDNNLDWPSELITRNNNQIDFGSYNVIVDPNATDVFAFDGTDTITIKADVFTADVITTGTISFNNNATATGIISESTGTTINITVNVRDAVNSDNISNARVFIRDSSNDTILNDITDSNGSVTTRYKITSNENITGNVRKSTDSPFYKSASISGQLLTTQNFSTNILLIKDE